MTVHTVGPGGNYSTLTAWEAAIPTGTLAADREAAMFNYADVPANNWAIAGFTTTASAKLIIRAATAAETGSVSAKHTGTAGTGARITKTGGSGYQCLRITDTNIRHFEFRDLELFSNGAAANAPISHNATTDYSRVINCISYSFNYGGILVTPTGATGDHLIANCALWDSILGHGFQGNAAVNIVHCTAIRQATFVAASVAGFRLAVVKNCYAANWGGGGGFTDYAGLVAGSSNNASLDTSGSAGLTGLAPADQFVSASAPWNLHLKAGSALEGAAAPVAIVVSDFEGDERDASIPDIGFDEYVAAGLPEIVGIATLPLARMTLAATGTLEDVVAPIAGTAAITLGRVTAASTGALAITGQAAASLRPMNIASASTLTLSGTAGLTLARMSVSATGALTNQPIITGSAALALARMSVSATGALTALSPQFGALSVTLRRMRSAATSVIREPPGPYVAREQSVIPTVAFDQSPTGWPQWLREIAQSVNLLSSWVGTSTTPGGGGDGGGTGSGTVTSVTAGAGLTGAPNPIIEAGTLSLSVPVTVARGGTGAVSHNVDAILAGAGTAALRSSGASVDAFGNVSSPLAYFATGAAGDGGFWWLQDGTTNWWGWYADAGMARFSRWAEGSGVNNDALTVDYASGAITAPGSLTAGTATAPSGGTLAGDINGQRVLVNGVPVGSGGGTITGVTAGTGLSGGGTSGAVTLNLTTPVSVANGGTGASTPAGALSNLGGISGNQTITLSGDLTGSGTTAINAQIAANAVGSTEIANSAVTFAKIQNVTAARLLGNPTGSAAAPSEVSLGTGLSFAGSVLNATVGGAGTVTSVAAGTGLTASPSPIVGAGTMSLTVPVTAANGGTNQTTWAQGDLLYASAANTLSKLAKDATATRYLSNTGTTNNPAWAQINLANGVSGTLPVGSGGTGATTGSVGPYLPTAGGTVSGNATMSSQLTINGTGAGGIPLVMATATTDCFLRHSNSAAAQVWTVGISNPDYWIYDTTHARVCIALAASSGACYNQSGTWNALSDGSLKQDVQPYERGLAAVQALNPVSFRYRAGTPFAGDEPSRILYGLIAEEVAPHIPEIVGETNASVAGEERTVATLESGVLIYALINAVKTLAAEVAELKANSLQGKGGGT